MASTLLPNKEIKLSRETDFFGHINKAEAIRQFLDANVKTSGENKMFALYGKWGSGKSTLMKYLESNLNNKNYLPIFFEAWKYEKDDNLALSLVDVISGSLKDKTTIKDLVEISFLALKNIGKGVKLEIPGFAIDAGKIIESTEKDIKKMFDELSTHSKIEQFKEKFSAAENKLCIEKKCKKIIIFIDDLDRCEPENILTLLSSIKLFFTYGSKVVFFFGVDKDAVSKAIKNKYGAIVNSEDYLEKIFDISFSMPRTYSIVKLLSHYFPQIYQTEDTIGPTGNYLQNFFKQINFTSPRHLKKVLNKYEILKSFKNSENIDSHYKSLIPNIINGEQGNLAETILVLYFIVLYEFHYKKFEELEDYKGKLTSYALSHRATWNSDKNENLQGKMTLENAIKAIHSHNDGITIDHPQKVSLKDISDICSHKHPDSSIKDFYKKWLTLFTPKEANTFSFVISDADYIKQFEIAKNKMLVNFCKYLIENKQLFSGMKSDYRFWNFFEMAKSLL